MLASLPRITVKANLPAYTAIYNDTDFGVDLPLQFMDYCVCLHSSESEKNIILLITEKAVDSGLAISINSELEQKKYNVTVYISTVEFIKLVRSSSFVKSKDGDNTKASTYQRANRFIQNALDLRASDIHFQVNDTDAAVYFRINGELTLQDMGTAHDYRLFLETHYTSFSDDHEQPGYTSTTPLSSTAIGTFLLQRPYIDLEGDIFKPHEVNVKVRKQSFPLSNNSADEVWRLIVDDEQSRLPNFKELGYNKNQVTILSTAIRKPKGLILFCGTTGSGKSMSSGVCLNQLNDYYKGRRSIRSIENPVELPIKGVRQWSIPDPSGYAKAIRTYMRSDPDIISVGEIIDVESATAAAHACLSGHLTFSTLHAGTPLKAIKRLEHYGIDRLTLSEEGFLNAIIIQSLIKKLCPDCKIPFIDSVENDLSDPFLQEELSELGCDKTTIYGKGAGCSRCANTGISGRRTIANVCEITSSMRERFGTSDLSNAFKDNSQSVLVHALQLLSEGIVSPVGILDECGTLSTDKFV
jgi:type II secretory ATPase GspE/PulE/Tfp pilus assembly ATPase PilB-like protein